MRAARLPHTPTNTWKSKRRSGTSAAWLRTRKTNSEKQKKQSRKLPGALRKKCAAVGEAANQTAEDLGRRAQDVYEQGRTTATKVGRNIQRGYHSSAEQVENAMEEYPLAVGIGFAALGALIGVLLPGTRREDELLGEQSDKLVKATKEKGEELLQRGKVVAQRVTESAVEEARQQGLTPETVGERISEFAGKVGEVVQKAKEEVGTAAKDEKLTVEHLKGEASSAAEGVKQDRKASVQEKSDEHSLLPKAAPGQGLVRQTGYQSQSALAPSLLTALADRATPRFNEGQSLIV